MKTPTYTVVLYKTDGTKHNVRVLDAKMALALVDATWNQETPEDNLELIVILRNGRPYLGCPRPE